jgi:hypothetical protein
LLAIDTFNEALIGSLRNRITLRSESHIARFYTARVIRVILRRSQHDRFTPDCVAKPCIIGMLLNAALRAPLVGAMGEP